MEEELDLERFIGEGNSWVSYHEEEDLVPIPEEDGWVGLGFKK